MNIDVKINKNTFLLNTATTIFLAVVIKYDRLPWGYRSTRGHPDIDDTVK
jgi:hypothetical protein